MDRIIIPDLPLRARIGVTDQERASEQKIFVSLTLHLDLSRAGDSDSLADTVDYDAVCASVEALAGERSFRLIEALAETIATALLHRYAVASVDVRIEKPGALKARGVPFAAVEIHREAP